MRSTAPLVPLVWLTALGACKVVDAPEALEDVVVYGFAHYDDDSRFLQATHQELHPQIAPRFEELTNGYRVTSLSDEDLERAGVELVRPVTEVIGALGAVDYRHDLAAVLEVITREDKDELFEHILAYEVTEATDRACFLARTCERLDQWVTETAKAGLLGEATRSYVQSFRWVELEGRPPAVYTRTLSPEPVDFTTNIARVHQQYALVALFPEGGGTRRVETFWVDAEVLGLDIPDTFAVDAAVNNMAKQAERIDDWIEGGG